MSNLSHVSMAQNQCPVCLTVFDSGEILLNKQLKPTMEPKTLTGHSMCPSCQGRKDEGFVALIEFKGQPQGEVAKRDQPRTGVYAHLRTSVFTQLFNQEPPDGMVCAVPEGFMAQLQKMTEMSDD